MPQITEITVSAGRTFNHPYENYSNLKPMITMKATLAEGEDPEKAVQQLQEQAERMIEDHKQRTLAEIRACYHIQQTRQELSSIERQIARLKQQADDLRENEYLALENPDYEEPHTTF